jgi:hypothetical protein
MVFCGTLADIRSAHDECLKLRLPPIAGTRLDNVGDEWLGTKRGSVSGLLVQRLMLEKRRGQSRAVKN